MSFVNSIITTQGLRHQNRAIVLNCIREFGEVSHTELGERTGLASGTISVITTEFLEEGVIEKVEYEHLKSRGRPRIQFRLQAGFSRIVLVRILAESIEFSLLDYRSTLLDRQVLARDQTLNEAAGFGPYFSHSLLRFVERSEMLPDDIKAISITAIGEIDEMSRALMWSPIFGDHTIDFRKLLAQEWRASVTLTNEVCFLAHNFYQKLVPVIRPTAGTRCAVLSLSDSIGLGVATLNDNGEIDLTAPAFGHMAHGMDGPLCRCGAQGCLEAYAGFNGILRTAFGVPGNSTPATFIPLEQMRHIAGLARNGDRTAEYAFRHAGRVLGICLSRMFTVLGPMPLSIVGTGLEFYDLIQAGLEEQLNSSFLARIGHRPAVTVWPEEAELAFESNAAVSLRTFDHAQVATRRYRREN